MPYTSNRGFSVQATSSNAGTWGSDGSTPTAGTSNALNQGVFQLLDQALGSTTTLSLSSSNVVLTQVEAQSGMLRCTGTLTASVDISTLATYWTGVYCWENITTGNFSVTVTNAGGSVALPQGRRGLMWIDAVNGPRVIAIAGASTADAVPAGSVVPFYNSSTPAGYTIVALNDYGIQIVSSGGGATTGSVAYSTLFARTATDSHTLTTAQIPSHSHSVPNVLSTTLNFGGNTAAYISGSTTTGLTGGGDGHTHDLDMRVQTAKVILATRN